MNIVGCLREFASIAKSAFLLAKRNAVYVSSASCCFVNEMRRWWSNLKNVKCSVEPRFQQISCLLVPDAGGIGGVGEGTRTKGGIWQNKML
jgi:hypothetical protein